jgi:hypothetical protein
MTDSSIALSGIAVRDYIEVYGKFTSLPEEKAVKD